MSPRDPGPTRAAILDAAAALLEDRGPESVTLRAVGEAAGVSRSAPYRHYADKAALMRALATDAETSQRFRAYISTEVLGPVAAAIGAGTAIAQRIEIVLSMMHGVVTMRYIVRLEPLASMPREQVRAQLAPLIQPLIDSAFNTPVF